MRFFKKAPDGGKDSGVTAYFLIEAKSLFSIALIHFNKGTRDVYHEHAFNALTLWLKGRVCEHHLDGRKKYYRAGQLKYTSRATFHKVEVLESTWAFSIRGPWLDYWREFRKDHYVTLTHGRLEK